MKATAQIRAAQEARAFRRERGAAADSELVVDVPDVRLHRFGAAPGVESTGAEHQHQQSCSYAAAR
jgi:hypothetical protein